MNRNLKTLCLSMAFGGLVLAGCTRTERTTVTTTETATDGPGYGQRHTEVTTTGDADRVSLDEVKEKSKEAFAVTTAYMTQERDKMSVEIKDTLDNVNRRLDELRARSGSSSGKEKAGIDIEIKGLENEKARLEEMRDKAGAATEKAWTNIKANWKELQGRVGEKLHNRDKASDHSGR